MKWLDYLLAGCLVIFLGSCSKSSTDGDAEEDGADVEMSDGGGSDAADGDAVEENLDGDSGDGTVAAAGDAAAGTEDTVSLDTSGQNLEEVAAPTDSASKDYTAEQPSGAAVADSSGSDSAPSGAATSDTSGIGDGEYVVKSNETLMLIAFNLYGDYGRWKEIASLNQDKLNGKTMISAGMKLRINSSGSGFSWSRDGKDHVVAKGDTLSLISKRFYGTLFKWKKIWENNKPLIKDPNRIFVGFTIYVPDVSRDMASEAPATQPAPEKAAPAQGDQMANQGTGAAPATSAPAEANDGFPADI
ncbi:MAG: LysM peptidoglycan-binding domain-containing protein [Bacteriovoracaceae bacterium]|nr:LysM peptidoglycan-binding domain-containing protein [Bacteriovoracaceae bacterium]